METYTDGKNLTKLDTVPETLKASCGSIDWCRCANLESHWGTTFHLTCVIILSRESSLIGFCSLKWQFSFMCPSELSFRSHVTNPSFFVLSLQPLMSSLSMSRIPQHTSRIPGFDYQPLESALIRSAKAPASHVTTSSTSSSSRGPERP